MKTRINKTILRDLLVASGELTLFIIETVAESCDYRISGHEQPNSAVNAK